MSRFLAFGCLLLSAASASAGLPSIKTGDFVKYRIADSDGEESFVKSTVLAVDEAADSLTLRIETTEAGKTTVETEPTKLSEFRRDGYDPADCEASGGAFRTVATHLGTFKDSCQFEFTAHGSSFLIQYSEKVPLTGLLSFHSIHPHAGSSSAMTLVECSK